MNSLFHLRADIVLVLSIPSDMSSRLFVSTTLLLLTLLPLYLKSYCAQYNQFLKIMQQGFSRNSRKVTQMLKQRKKAGEHTSKTLRSVDFLSVYNVNNDLYLQIQKATNFNIYSINLLNETRCLKQIFVMYNYLKLLKLLFKTVKDHVFITKHLPIHFFLSSNLFTDLTPYSNII